MIDQPSPTDQESDEDKPWVVAWAVPRQKMEIPCWLMVRHRERGWELPGGTAYADETPEITALRELFEETGLLGTATTIDSNLFNGGTVVRIEVDEEPQPYGWESKDENITEVGWCVDIPGELYWGEDEVQRLLNHDWSNSRSLSS